MKNKKMIAIIGGVLVVIIAVVLVVLFIPKNDNKKDKDKEPDKTEKKKVLSEKEMVDAYGFSIKDAEDTVGQLFHSDNFEFKTEINEDNFYIVTVTDVISGDTYKYEVNPQTHQALEIRDKQK
jgi:hypothetical protein